MGLCQYYLCFFLCAIITCSRLQFEIAQIAKKLLYSNFENHFLTVLVLAHTDWVISFQCCSKDIRLLAKIILSRLNEGAKHPMLSVDVPTVLKIEAEITVFSAGEFQQQLALSDNTGYLYLTIIQIDYF